MDIDPRFSEARQKATWRQQRKRLRLGALLGGGLTLTGLVVWGAIRWMLADPTPEIATAPDGSEILVQSEATTFEALVAAAAPFIDIPGDPMILHFDQAVTGGTRRLAGPATLDPARIGAVRSDRLLLIENALIPRETRLMTVLPSSREDFAFFQAQQSRFLDETGPEQPEAEATPATISTEGLSEIWGDALESGTETESFTRTAIQNTTTLTRVRAEPDRRKIFDERVLLLETDSPLADLLRAQGVFDPVAERFTSATARLLPGSDRLAAGQLVALRLTETRDGAEPLQFSLYGTDGYLGSIARTGPGRYEPAADPWVDTDLMALSAETERSGPAAAQNYRLLDAIYSAAIRNRLPTALVGELIVMMSQVHDLDGFASQGDRVTILYAPGTSASGPGSILFAGVTGPARDMKCYVIPKPEADGYACYDPFRGSTGSAMATPVRGWPMSSPFGPRRHPILKTVRAHNGVDWAAPIGTPVLAAFGGTVASTPVTEGYGNLVILDHGNGLETRYAHLDSFAVKAGASVRAGERIGTVGTTGLSTGPHLHFEVRLNSAPVDPMTYAGGGALTASVEVEALTNRIIQVESGGDATAQNPRSTATGLGQFIDGTWIRMMRTYRPDLVTTMSREDLLALRTNPALARDMVQRLARENEAYLRNRGHRVTAGRLYLAHFLGPEGADMALKAGDALTVEEVMGTDVVRANPFLKDYSIGTLKAWADSKMVSQTGPRAAPAPPEVRDFMAAVDEALAVPL